MDVAAWFDKRTYHHRDFAKLSHLIDEKRRQGTTVSVCLPTLDSAATLDIMLRIIKEILVDEYPLIDQLAIVDSHSTDGTIEIAKARGVEVYQDDEYLTKVPKAGGKGEALWKSLFFLKGDIICWIDSDIKNIHPRFIYGPVGALITHQELKYVKGFYSRPLTTGGITEPMGGGRVTEIMARPFINMFYPELAGFIQPLSGEYAGRRDILEKIPFFTGYGVELGLLIDILRSSGLDSMAQVNLETRVHGNQSTQALGRMSFGIMQAAFKRLDDDQKIKLQTEMNKEFRMIHYENDQFKLEKREIEVIERPPMNTIKEYLKERKAG